MTALILGAVVVSLAVVRLAAWLPVHRAAVAEQTAEHVAWLRNVAGQPAERPEFVGRSWVEVAR